MRIAILDDYQDCVKTLDCFAMLRGHQISIINDYFPQPAHLATKLNDPQALVLTRTRTNVDEELLNLLPSLEVISQTGKNPGHIDVKACEKHGVHILESRGNPIATAELTWALIMNGMRLLPQAIAGMKAGRWQTNIGRRIHGKRLGIWGYGKIGKRVAEYARTFGSEVVIWGSKESRVKAKDDGYVSAKSKKEFFSTCDIISLHLRLRDATQGIVGLADLQSMKTDALFVNTARAALIENSALLKSLNSGRPGFAAIDVYDEEPIFDKEHPFLNMSNVICTPHLGYVERAGYELYFAQAFQNLLDYIQAK